MVSIILKSTGHYHNLISKQPIHANLQYQNSSPKIMYHLHYQVLNKVADQVDPEQYTFYVNNLTDNNSTPVIRPIMSAFLATQIFQANKRILPIK